MTVAEPVAVERTPSASEREGRFVFENVTWDFYEQTLKQLERSGQHARVTFDDGRMEIVTTTGWHEGIKKSIARLLEHYSFVRDVPIQGYGSVTHKREDLRKALEPDECYFIASKIVLDANGHLDLVKGPPPDVVIEVEVTRPDFPKRPIYALIGVPELWSVSADRITPLTLEGTEYVPVPTSRFLPDLDFGKLFEFVQMARDDQHAAVRAFHAWLTAGRPTEGNPK